MPNDDDEVLRALILALDTREQETAGHSYRVAIWTLFLSLVAGVPGDELRTIHRGALLHDLGKLGIPDPILLKQGELTPTEWAVMRTHPRLGRDIVHEIAHLRPAAEILWAHHEHWDGGGYPRGLKAEEIPLGARLFAIVDVYDALRSARPYKRAWTHEESVACVRQSSGTHLDPRICAHFFDIPESTWLELSPPRLARLSYEQQLVLVQSALKALRRRCPVRA